jgi:hypothetical protein|tara:strand:- start:97 stop:507 length:411 start_codon:yes stop_codon:yes gene_type:complete
MVASISKRVLLLAALFSLAVGAMACDEEKGLKIKSISPKTGPADGAGNITIHGNGFKQSGHIGVEIYFGDKKARFLRFEGDTKMVVVPPPGEVGQTVDVEVIFGDGRGHKFPEAYSYIDPKEGFNVNALAPGDKKE